ncbi:GUN4 domain-containing protein [Laspinema olomoucense]|uniref:GUN4 domain-containing protein n=1 Tax=Laspinema olomoucense TaxID=3231600 RepID=UPI0021BB8F9D|nr:GUN4 domain-containing protein [Laspinema sp. D3d]MCT7975567.1 GUN4 domain-containing protein [Laspinema sp. D3d]
MDRKIDDVELVPPKQFVPSLSDTVNKAVLKGMELNPKNRPQTMGEWLSLLQPPIPTTTVSPRYQKLQQFLAAGKWREADAETKRVMLQVAGREEWLDEDSINQFPCEDLRQIDGIWVQYSNGRFGFSVQKRIWQECGGKEDYETACRVADRVGWTKEGSWIDYDECTFTSKAPPGHLPLRSLFSWDDRYTWYGPGHYQSIFHIVLYDYCDEWALSLPSFASRLVNCNL